MKRILCALLIISVVGGVAYQVDFVHPATAETACLHVSGTERVGRVAAKICGWWHKTSADTDGVDPAEQQTIKDQVDGSNKWLGMIGSAFATGVRSGEAAADQLVTSFAPPPIDCAPISAACQGLGANGVPSGPDLAADALVKAGFPPKEIPIFVAIAKAESGFNPKAWNSYGAGMAGMWQLNQAYWKLSNWQDPYANARMAKKVRDESIKSGRTAWYPWSTWRGALKAAPQYKRYATLSNTPSATGGSAIPLDQATAAITDPNCTADLAANAANTGGPATAGQWNVFYKNSTARINANAGFADLVCLNEIRDNKGLKPPGYQVTPGSMAVPIIWRADRLDKIELHRTTVLTGYARDKSAVHGVWRVRSTGKTFAAVCTHMLVQGGSGWLKQSANVNRIRDAYRRRGLPVIMLGDMNAHLNKVARFFAGNALGGRIDYAVGYGIKPSKQEALGKAGSDHERRRFTFASLSPVPSDKSAMIGKPQSQGGGPVPAEFDHQGNPRTVEQAISWLQAHPNGAPGEKVRGRCERYMNLAFGLGSGYGSAITHWFARGPRSTSGTPPRGALIFFGPTVHNLFGHVALSVGNGRAISTDFDGNGWAPGKITEGPIDKIKFGKYLGYRAPNFQKGSGR